MANDSQDNFESSLEREFNLPRAQAEISYWSKLAYWTLDEFAALSLGKEPRRIDWRDFELLADRSPTIREICARWEIARRAYQQSKLYFENRLVEIVQWANEIGLSFPDDLSSAVKLIGGAQKDWK